MKLDFTCDLAALPEGRPARIEAIDARDLDLARLEVMGLCAGRTVEVAKGGYPMIVRVLGTRIGLAASLARAIRVRIGD